MMRTPVRGRVASTWRTVLLFTAVVFGGLIVAEACSIPVFRYALERWRPDPYRVTIFHRGPLGETDQALVNSLADRQERSQLNVAVTSVDVADLEDAAGQELYAALGEPERPTFVVQYPEMLRITKPLWSAPLAAEHVTALSESRLRDELVRLLCEGETAVWLLLESGNAEKDDAAAALIEEQLKVLEQELELPELAAGDELQASAPLKVAFTLLRVPRGQAEQPLVEMLLGSEPDLVEFDDPMVFPVFGRGRAMLPLVGAGITADNIQEAGAFLAGSCSCEVKELNPGFDLLLAADWDELLGGLDPAASIKSVPTGEPELLPIPSGSKAQREDEVTAKNESAPKAEAGVSDKSSAVPAATGTNIVILAAALLAIAVCLTVVQFRGRGATHE